MNKNIFLAVALLLAFAQQASSAILPPGFAEIQLAEGLNPTAMALAPDGNLFLAQKDGRVFLLHADGELHDEPFLQLAVDGFNERGLAGIALHPNFAQEPWVYLYYTVPGAAYNRISRVLANGDFAVPGSEQVLLDLDLLSGSIHNGGAMVFGPDDNLYVGVGDGASPANAQSMNSVLGKILRLTPSGDIPATNPFFDQLQGRLRAIYATGVRNPFSMSCDPVSGRIFFCDVGNGAWEEVNELSAGKNYGWSLIEGPIAGQSPPAGYQEPFFAYPHTEGCAVVGAAFGFAPHPALPPEFQGKFFFADYCKGWIKMLDPATGAVGGTFATGIDRPVSIVVTPAGELYYFARAGLGGGSPGDNTASDEGTLYKVFRIGDGPPRFTGHPQAILVPAGETAHFTATAFGSQPIDYQWFKNSAPIPGANTPELTLPDLLLSDSGAVLFCRAINPFGTDTSEAAILQVTANQRPAPTILFPLPGDTYRCGDTLYFSGQAIDPENGVLPPQQLSWRIDFHHADHTHPAMPPVTGISEGTFFIPNVGETATDVFFRVYLSAVDQAGLVRTVWHDVHPERTSIQVNGPAGIPVNIDGQIRPLPAVFESVINIQRNLQAAIFHRSGDTLYYFREWSNGTSSAVLTFQAPEVPTSFNVLYDRFTLGNGSGLRGEYFFDPDATLSDTPVLVRVDTVVNFVWGAQSPDPSQLPADYFSVRWTGFVEPVFDDTYTFSVSSDDGCRLWIGDSLLIDKWQPQPETEHSGSMVLQGGKQYPIRLEYFEKGGGATAKLYWSSPRQPKEIIPKRQLYEPDTLHTASIRGIAGLDDNLNGVWDAGESILPNVTVSLFLVANDSLLAVQKTMPNGQFSFTGLASDSYYLHLMPPTNSATLTPVENLDAAGTTPVFSLKNGEELNLNTAWVINQAALYGIVWLDQNRNDLRESSEPGLKNIAVLLYRSDSSFVAARATDDTGGYLFDLVEPDTYFLLFSSQLSGIPLAPGFGLSDQRRTVEFDMQVAKSREVVVAFVPQDISKTTGHTAENSGLSLYPNPASDRIWATLESPVDQLASLEIVDLAGRVLFRQQNWAHSGKNTWILQVDQLPPGMYTVICRSAVGVWTQRFLI